MQSSSDQQKKFPRLKDKVRVFGEEGEVTAVTMMRSPTSRLLYSVRTNRGHVLELVREEHVILLENQ